MDLRDVLLAVIIVSILLLAIIAVGVVFDDGMQTRDFCDARCLQKTNTVLEYETCKDACYETGGVK